jgi:hypothetical protein
MSEKDGAVGTLLHYIDKGVSTRRQVDVRNGLEFVHESQARGDIWKQPCRLEIFDAHIDLSYGLGLTRILHEHSIDDVAGEQLRKMALRGSEWVKSGV